jgi:threonine synthase
LGKLDKYEFSQMIDKAYSSFRKSEIIPLLKINDIQYLMEEYYGPTASFKDLALQLFPLMFQKSISDNNEKFSILVATSGDTGSAVLDGFSNTTIPVIVLYPSGSVSSIQELQMITAKSYEYVLGVNKDFDYCQNTVKSIFHDFDYLRMIKEKTGISLTSANSINWGRLLPQIFYTINSYLELVKVYIYNIVRSHKIWRISRCMYSIWKFWKYSWSLYR